MKTSYLSILAIPVAVCMVSCSKTAEDYQSDCVDLMEEIVAVVEATTPENSAEQAKKIKELAAEMKELEKEVKEKGLENAPVTPEFKARMEAAGKRIGEWAVKNAGKMDKMDPSFMEALGSIG